MSQSFPYSVIVRPLTQEEGGGFLAEFPDVGGCYGDGNTPEEAVHEAQLALDSWIKTAQEFGDPLPLSKEHYSGQWRLRIPKSLHAQLAYRARDEGVSLNTLVSTILAEYVGPIHSYSRHNLPHTTKHR